jgi:TRAP-type uncharacterized transport system substrate-binding protein
LAQAPGGARFIGPSPDQIRQIVKKYPLLKDMTVQPGAYPGIDKALATVGSVNLILVRDDFDAARAGAFSTSANTRASAPSPDLLHPAVSPAT